MRINRWTSGRREMLNGHALTSGLVQGHFVVDGQGIDEPIPSLPGIHRQSVDVLRQRIAEDVNMGVLGHMLFPVHPQEAKDPDGRLGLNSDGPMLRALKVLREDHGEAVVLMADVCMCTVTDHGHCGHVAGDAILNDETVATLAQMAVLAAQAGADYVGASDMMDGRVGAIRTALEDAGHHSTGVLSYAVKYASAFYGPFRDAAGSSPQSGDRRSHQMDPRASVNEAVMEAQLDEAEGADLLMVKPALPTSTWWLRFERPPAARSRCTTSAGNTPWSMLSIPMQTSAGRGGGDHARLPTGRSQRHRHLPCQRDL